MRTWSAVDAKDENLMKRAADVYEQEIDVGNEWQKYSGDCRKTLLKDQFYNTQAISKPVHADLLVALYSTFLVGNRSI